MEHDLSYVIVFLAGMVSFLSPCVLPIVPAYLSLISGLSFEELQEESSVQHARWRLLTSALAFILGFSIVTVVLLGGLASLITSFGATARMISRYVGGGIVIIFALHLMGVFRIPILFMERRFHLTNSRVTLAGAMLIGAAFAFGWSPCIGPILSGVLAFAAGTATPATAWTLLVAYTLGLAVPFFLAALFVQFFLKSLRKMTRYLRVIEIVSGILLLIMGILLLTDQLGAISRQGGFLLGISDFLERMLQ